MCVAQGAFLLGSAALDLSCHCVHLRAPKPSQSPVRMGPACLRASPWGEGGRREGSMVGWPRRSHRMGLPAQPNPPRWEHRSTTSLWQSCVCVCVCVCPYSMSNTDIQSESPCGKPRALPCSQRVRETALWVSFLSSALGTVLVVWGLY